MKRMTDELLDALMGTYRLAYEQKHPVAGTILEILQNAGIIFNQDAKDPEKILTKPDGIVQYTPGDDDRHDADDDEGRWVTTEGGKHIHLNEEGEPDKGNPHVIAAMTEGGSAGASPKASEGEQSSESSGQEKPKTNRPPSGTKAQKDHTVTGKSEEVQKIYDEMRANEPQITDDLCGITSDIGCEMFGLDFSVKTGSSVSEKIDRKRVEKQLGPEVTDEQIIRGFADVVRYTAMGPHDELVSKTNGIIDGLEKAGYKVPKVENKYLGKEPDYKGIHLDVVSPTGQKFELQVHSKESMECKEINHKLYEESRKVDTPPERKAELERQMRENAAALPQPKDIEDLKNRG